MQNKCNCGCDCQPGSGQGFVPVNGNWDFNMNGDCGCQQNYGCQSGSDRRNRRNNDCSCDECGKTYARARNDSDCQCERCDDSRKVMRCDQNTYVRDMDDCECKDRDRDRGNDCQKCDECESAYAWGRTACTGKDDCQCESCVRNRSRRNKDCDKDCECGDNQYNNRSRRCSNGCEKDWDKDDGAYNRGRSGKCGCDKDNASTYARSGKNRKVGMINVEKQEIDEIFESESALRAGTLFPELHKPMNGYCPCDKNCGTCKQQAAFAAWEMRLYLNTHPNDKEALKLFRKLCKEAEEENYATTFLTDECCTGAWTWVKNPWPWEYDCQCGD